MQDSCNKLTILLIDRDEAFRTALSSILREDGHGVLEYDDPGHVPPIRELDAVDLAVSDCSPSEREALAFAADFHTARPEVPMILLTTYHADDYNGRCRRIPHLYVLPKPVDYETFHALIHELAG
ncbi:response regulator [Candidatus Binatia bacterium]|nr:response regulator [Candidatus Binatia bacterium]